MDLRCPKCNSTDLRKVSLAYEEGLYRGEGHARLRSDLIGGSGPDLVVGRASARAARQSELSKQFRSPVKRSYRKLIFWSALVFLSGGWLVVCVNTITENVTTVLSLALTAYVLVASMIFAFISALVVKHNHSVYPKRFAEWNHSFICQRCGSVSSHG
jgi:hypothetical protein